MATMKGTVYIRAVFSNAYLSPGRQLRRSSW